METLKDDRAEKARALGLAAMVLAILASGLGAAFVLSKFQGGLYIPLLMPFLVGRLLGTVAWKSGTRFAPMPYGATIVVASLGALIGTLGHYAFSYLAVLTLFEAQTGAPGSELLETLTGMEGFEAFLTFSTFTEGHSVSPLGVLGKTIETIEPVYAIMAIEALVGVLGAWRGVVRVARPKSPTRVRIEPGESRLIAQVTGESLAEIMRALDEDNFIRAGRLLAYAEPDPEYRVTLLFPEVAEHAHVLQIATGQTRQVKAKRLLPVEDALLIMDQVRLADAKRLYTAEGSETL